MTRIFVTWLIIGGICGFIAIRLSGLPNADREERAWSIGLSLYAGCWLIVFLSLRIQDVLT